MRAGYSPTLLVCFSLVHLSIFCRTSCAHQDAHEEAIKTIVLTDQFGIERTEHAFAAPSKGLPYYALDLFCSSIKLRLYWGGYREQIKRTHRKSVYLRRMARFAKHVFDEVRDVDKPFNATMLSRVDKTFWAKFDVSKSSDDEEDFDDDDDEAQQSKSKNIKKKISKMVAKKDNEILEEIDSDEAVKELEKQGQQTAVQRMRQFVKNWSWKKAALWLYTRSTTMWWMTLSCLYSKYYLWDPALDEFTKLKRTLLMWPELQMVRLQDLKCKPVLFFRRLMDICKIMNPLMRMDFGQFRYDKLTRFKKDTI